MQLHNYLQTIHSAPLQTFYRSNLFLKVNGRLQFWEYLTHHVGKEPQKEVSCFLMRKLSNSFDFYYLEPGSNPSITDIVDGMNIFFQEWHNHNKNCITVEGFQKAQTNEIYLPNEGSGHASFSMDLGHFLGSNNGNEVGMMFGEKRPHKRECADDIVRMQSLMIHTDLTE